LWPENSFLALELGWQTVGTADFADNVIHAWVAEMLTNPTWGVVQYTENASVAAIFGVAGLHRRLASGEMPYIAAWDSADRAARALSTTLAGPGLYAMRAAYQSTALVDTECCETLDVVTGNALRAHTLATEGTGAARIVEVTRHAIRSWRRLAQLDDPGCKFESMRGNQPSSPSNPQADKVFQHGKVHDEFRGASAFSR
jgi:hypothetical protein